VTINICQHPTAKLHPATKTNPWSPTTQRTSGKRKTPTFTKSEYLTFSFISRFPLKFVSNGTPLVIVTRPRQTRSQQTAQTLRRHALHSSPYVRYRANIAHRALIRLNFCVFRTFPLPDQLVPRHQILLLVFTLRFSQATLLSTLPLNTVHQRYHYFNSLLPFTYPIFPFSIRSYNPTS